MALQFTPWFTLVSHSCHLVHTCHTHPSQAAKILTRLLGPKHVDVAYVQMRTAQLLYSQRKLDQAHALLRSVQDVYKVLGLAGVA